VIEIYTLSRLQSALEDAFSWSTERPNHIQQLVQLATCHSEPRTPPFTVSKEEFWVGESGLEEGTTVGDDKMDVDDAEVEDKNKNDPMDDHKDAVKATFDKTPDLTTWTLAPHNTEPRERFWFGRLFARPKEYRKTWTPLMAYDSNGILSTYRSIIR